MVSFPSWTSRVRQPLPPHPFNCQHIPECSRYLFTSITLNRPLKSEVEATSSRDASPLLRGAVLIHARGGSSKSLWFWKAGRRRVKCCRSTWNVHMHIESFWKL